MSTMHTHSQTDRQQDLQVKESSGNAGEPPSLSLELGVPAVCPLGGAPGAQSSIQPLGPGDRAGAGQEANTERQGRRPGPPETLVCVPVAQVHEEPSRDSGPAW